MKAIRTSAALLSVLLSAGALAQGTPLSVPSDSKASYFVLEKGGKSNLRTIVTRRSGSSGETFSKREFDCIKNLVRYLGTGDTMTEMKASRPNEKLSPIVPGSIAYYVGHVACEK